MSPNIHLIRKVVTSGLAGLQGNQTKLLKNGLQESLFTNSVAYRYLPEPIKRFYRDATVEKTTGGYEVHLDRKPLKTPGKKNLNIHDEKLASAVAAEWSAQKNVVRPNVMHLTALCNTAQDNPLRKEKVDLVDQIVNNLLMDTILYRADEDDAQDNEKLLTLQRQQWDPIIDWFQNEFRVPLPISTGIFPPPIPDETIQALKKFLSDCSLEAIEGFHFGSDAIKSVILTVATVLDRLTPKEAVHLSRLEVEYQAQHWGVVEWHHEVELFDSIARLSAATLFFDFHRPYASR